MLDKDLASPREFGTLRGMRGTLTLLAVLAALTALPASAGTLYKCTGADGVPAYVSKRVSGSNCEIVSRYTPDRSRPAQVASVSRPAEATPAIGAAVSPALSDSASAIVPAAAPAQAPAATGPRRVVSGQVYSYIKDGVRHYTSARPQGGTQVAPDPQDLRVVCRYFTEIRLDAHKTLEGAAQGRGRAVAVLDDQGVRDVIAHDFWHR